jgi:two-component system response regulator AlgR
MKLLIADDEPLARQRIVNLLSDQQQIEIVGEVANGREVIDRCETQHVDCVLLDIKMPLLDGLEAARHMSHLINPPAIIFCTAYDSHALAAFEAKAVDYLVKPVRRERLLEALERARRYTGEQAHQLAQAAQPESRRTHICARVRGSLKLIPVDQIMFFSAEEKYVLVHEIQGHEVLIEESLKNLELEFHEQFVRIHRHSLVAINYITGLQRTSSGQFFVQLRNRAMGLEVSRRNLPSVRKRVKHL